MGQSNLAWGPSAGPDSVSTHLCDPGKVTCSDGLFSLSVFGVFTGPISSYANRNLLQTLLEFS